MTHRHIKRLTDACSEGQPHQISMPSLQGGGLQVKADQFATRDLAEQFIKSLCSQHCLILTHHCRTSGQFRRVNLIKTVHRMSGSKTNALRPGSAGGSAWQYAAATTGLIAIQQAAKTASQVKLVSKPGQAIGLNVAIDQGILKPRHHRRQIRIALDRDQGPGGGQPIQSLA